MKMLALHNAFVFLLSSFCIAALVGAQAPPSSTAINDLQISEGGTCGDSDLIRGKIAYLVNKNANHRIRATIKIFTVNSEGPTETSVAQYTIKPKGRIELGCTRAGSGAPVVLEITYSVAKAVRVD